MNLLEGIWVCSQERNMSGEGMCRPLVLLPEVSMIWTMVTGLPEVRERGMSGDFIKA